ncbi:hypothetical protein [Pendulispora albinea]|uniref:Peptidase A1 domain-containing protein n=1 Tax=Pendulispora albinea TaxID=2741071 RepID=A0ABZ2LW43_9BACT
MSYCINIAIDSEGLKKIYSVGQTVTLCKGVMGHVQSKVAGQTGSTVAWIAFSPLQSNDVVYDELSYYLFATTTPLQFGNVISMSSQTPSPAQAGWTYTFDQGHFSGVPGSGTTYNVYNGAIATTMAFGLAQSASVNNVSVLAPQVALPVLYNQTVFFQPSTTVSIFLSSCQANGTILGGISSLALAVTPTREKPAVNVGFNDATNTFYLIG